MADDPIHIEIKGLDKLEKAIKRFPSEAKKYLGQAGGEAAERVVFKIQGLKKYPPATSANQPPAPYYIRGRGMQYKNYNDMRSEKLGTKWYSKAEGYETRIGNIASYAKYVHGDDDQASFMEPKGWRKLKEATQEKIADITKVYQAWVDKLLRDIGL